MIFDPDQWYRSNASSFQAFVWDEDIEDVLQHALPVDYEPYFLCGVRFRWQTRKERLANPYTGPFMVTGSIHAFRSFRDAGDTTFFIGSQKLHPELFKSAETLDEERILDINGLIHFRHGHEFKKPNSEDRFIEPTWFTHNWRIRNYTTSQVVEFPEMRGVFRKFTQGTRKLLRYGIANPRSSRDMKNCKMSEAFASRVRNGEINALAEIGMPLK